MILQHKTFSFETKEVSDAGEFSGYLSVFGVLDSYREIVKHGAFADTLKDWKLKNRLPPVLWQHRSSEPIGPFVLMKEDDKGLYVEGKLLLELQRAKEAHLLLKHKVVNGMSIGFETIGEEYDKDQRIRSLTKVKLWEGSIVTFPANEESLVDVVKTALGGGKLPDLKTFENFLREAGFSKTQATGLASRGLASMLRSESEGNGGVDPAADALAAIKSLDFNF